MTTTANNISVVLSGGTVNIDPNSSLGGDPSSSPVPNNSLNNLFSDISTDQSLNGHEDYRCVYFFNDGDTTIWNVEVWIASDDSDGATMEIGVESRNEAQRITISGGVTGGTLTLSYSGQEFTTSYNSDLAEWAAELQTLLEELTDSEDVLFFKDITVTAQNGSGGAVIFDIKWAGKDAKRDFEKLQEATNGNLLEPIGNISVSLTVPQQGAPINTIASEINVDTTPPGNVQFYAASEVSPITLPRLNSGDGFPLWVKRVTVAGTAAKENDKLSLRFSAQSLEPA